MEKTNPGEFACPCAVPLLPPDGLMMMLSAVVVRTYPTSVFIMDNMQIGFRTLPIATTMFVPNVVPQIYCIVVSGSAPLNCDAI